MALVIADRVKESTTTTGTGAVTLAGAATGYQAFSAAIGNGNTTYYCIADQGGANWEIGVGAYTTAGNTLSRSTVLASSNAGALVSFGAGTKDVFVTFPANKSPDPGEIGFFAASSAPTGWLKANGAAVSRTTYANLFAFIGTTFGVGDGSTTFNIPDLRGEFLRGFDDGRGVDTGRVLGSAQGYDLQSHSHVVYAYSGNVWNTALSFLSDANNGHAVGTTATGGSETRPRNIALLACISY